MIAFRWGLIAAVMAAASGWAQPVYRWEDADGGIHYTDDLATIPPKFRPASRPIVGPELGVLSVKDAEPPEAPKATAVPARAVEDRSRQEAQERDSERQWRSSFRAAHRKIEDIEGAIKADKARLDNPATSGLFLFNPGTGQYMQTTEYEQVKERIRKAELELKHARTDLEDLDREASRYAIPREWRR